MPVVVSSVRNRVRVASSSPTGAVVSPRGSKVQANGNKGTVRIEFTKASPGASPVERKLSIRVPQRTTVIGTISARPVGTLPPDDDMSFAYYPDKSLETVTIDNGEILSFSNDGEGRMIQMDSNLEVDPQVRLTYNADGLPDRAVFGLD